MDIGVFLLIYAQRTKMRHDLLVKSLINFLIPIIFLYGLFFMADLFIKNGFFAIIYCFVLILFGLMMNNITKNFENIVSIKYQPDFISFSFSLISVIYVLLIIILVTDQFSI